MKKLLLAGMAITFSMNSMAFAEGDRALNVQRLTMEERQNLKADLIKQIATTRVDLANLKDELSRKKDERMDVAFSSLKALGAAAIGGLSAIVLATKIPAMKTRTNQLQATAAVTVIASLSLIFGEDGYSKTIQSEILAKSELLTAEGIKGLVADIEILESQLEAISKTLQQ